MDQFTESYNEMLNERDFNDDMIETLALAVQKFVLDMATSTTEKDFAAGMAGAKMQADRTGKNLALAIKKGFKDTGGMGGLTPDAVKWAKAEFKKNVKGV